MQIASHVSDDELFTSTIDIFSGRALLWYRSARKTVNNWHQLERSLKEKFQPHDYNERLFEEIKRRSQGPDESIGVYLSVMNSIFSRLSCDISESLKLKILLRNILPFYQNQLGLVNISSVAELKILCPKLEVRRQEAQSSANPSRRNVLEPDFAYVDASSSSRENCSVVNEVTKPQFLCHNCDKPVHKAIGCLEPKRLRCYRCKRVGFTTRTCPDCSRTPNKRFPENDQARR